MAIYSTGTAAMIRKVMGGGNQADQWKSLSAQEMTVRVSGEARGKWKIKEKNRWPQIWSPKGTDVCGKTPERGVIQGPVSLSLYLNAKHSALIAIWAADAASCSRGKVWCGFHADYQVPGLAAPSEDSHSALQHQLLG